MSVALTRTQQDLCPWLQCLQDLVRHHVESFNYLLEDGLQRAVEDIRPQELVDPHGRRVVLALEAASIGLPTADMKNVHAKSVQVFPSEVGVASGQGWGTFIPPGSC